MFFILFVLAEDQKHLRDWEKMMTESKEHGPSLPARLSSEHSALTQSLSTCCRQTRFGHRLSFSRSRILQPRTPTTSPSGARRSSRTRPQHFSTPNTPTSPRPRLKIANDGS